MTKRINLLIEWVQELSFGLEIESSGLERAAHIGLGGPQTEDRDVSREIIATYFRTRFPARSYFFPFSVTKMPA